MAALVEWVGLPPEARVLIVSCHDLSFSQAANVAVYDSLRRVSPPPLG
jgi:hypothetical protein